MKNNVISYTLTIYRHHKGKSKFVLSVEWSVDVANLNLHPVSPEQLKIVETWEYTKKST